HVLASTVPNLFAYDPAFAYELAVIIQDGIRRMYRDQEDIFYYITLGNEKYPMPAMPAGSEEGILSGMYRLRPPATQSKGTKIHLMGSGSILREALRAQDLLAERFGIQADVWSVTSYKALRRQALEVERWNRLHPSAAPRRSYLQQVLEQEEGIFI